jgi:serine/threonine-protein kinase
MRSLKNIKISRYTILEELGQSAFSKIFRAHDPINERDVILRILETNLPQQQKQALLQRFLEEARAVAKLRHPNIVAMLDVGESGDTHFLVTEFVAGRSIENLLRDGALPAEQAISIATQAAEGLAHAHAMGIIHRGLKPSKFLLDHDGRLRITDFGVAGVAETSISRIGQMLHAPRYIAPEQVTGQTADARTDIYALGAVLYEMATGQPAFGHQSGSKVHHLLKEIVATVPARPSTIRPGLSAALDAIICRLLEKSPEDRYQSAAQLVATLRRLKRIIKPATKLTGTASTFTPPQPAPATRPTSTTPAATPAPQEDVWRDFESGLVADIERFKDQSDDILARAKKSENQVANQTLQTSRKTFNTGADFPTIFVGHLASPASALPKLGVGTLLGDLTSAAQYMTEQNKTNEVRSTALSNEEARAIDLRMRQLFEYLSDLAAQLNIIKPRIPHVYHLPSVGEIGGLAWDFGRVDCRPHGHEISSRIEQVSLSYTLSGKQSYELIRDAASADALRKALIAARAVFSEEQIYGTTGATREIIITIPGTIKVSAEFSVDYKTGTVQLLLTNAERFARAPFRIAPEALTLAFFEELGQRLLGRPNRLADYLTPLNALDPQSKR